MHGYKTAFIFILIFAVGYFLGYGYSSFFAGRGRHQLRERILTEHLEQVNSDLRAAHAAQREAAQRSARLQAELQRIAEYARSIETGTERIEARTGDLAERLDGIIEQSGKLTDGIDNAFDSLEESRILLGELGTILRSLPTGIRNTNPES